MDFRRALISRETKETAIELELDLDGGPANIATDVKFLDHMLDAFAKHSGCGLRVRARGDGMDHHHLIEDVGIALGSAIREALGERRGLARFGSQAVPLDDALVLASVDLSGRAWLNFDVRFGVENLGDLKTELISHFFHSVSDNGRFNLHLVQMAGEIPTTYARRRSKRSRARSRRRRCARANSRFHRRKDCWHSVCR